MLYVSHDLEPLRPYLTQIVLLNRRVIFSGTPEALGDRADMQRELIEAALAADHHADQGGQPRWPTSSLR